MGEVSEMTVIWRCQYCKRDFRTKEEAEICEASHLMPQYVRPGGKGYGYAWDAKYPRVVTVGFFKPNGEAVEACYEINKLDYEKLKKDE